MCLVQNEYEQRDGGGKTAICTVVGMYIYILKSVTNDRNFRQKSLHCRQSQPHYQCQPGSKQLQGTVSLFINFLFQPFATSTYADKTVNNNIYGVLIWYFIIRSELKKKITL